jgi:endoglycosylceramidase
VLPLALVALACAGSATEAGGTDVPGEAPATSCATIPAVVPTGARLTVDPATGRLVDAAGRDVMLRGVNAGGRSKFSPFVPFPMDADSDLATMRAKADDFFARLATWGANAVRLGIFWEAIEPSPGQDDARYLDRYEAMISAAWAHGIRVIVDMHQDVYASPFCGDGFPPWTLPDPGEPHHDCDTWYLGYVINPDVRAAFDRFWADEGGVRTKFVAMWDRVVARFADVPGIVAFEMLNEPGAGTASEMAAFKAGVLMPFYTDLAARIRAAAPWALVLYDLPPTDSMGASNPTLDRPAGEGIVFAPHHYDFGLLVGSGWSGTWPEDAMASFGAFRDAAKTPVLVGEFGAVPGLDHVMEWLDRALAALDANRLSGTLWEYSRYDEPWNNEDLSVIAPDGSERSTLEAFVRPWLRAVAGTGAAFAWDRVARRAEARWTADGGVTEIAVPSRAFPDGPVGLTVEGEGACATWDPSRAELRVQAPAGSDVHVTFAAPPWT